ncbi:60S ribosomal protein L7a-2-like protein [Tanacetum coccineum]
MVSVVLAGCSRVVGLAGGFGCGVKCLRSNHIDSVLVYLMMVLWFSRYIGTFTIKETQHYAETSFCEVIPCILPECSLLFLDVPYAAAVKNEKPWWKAGDKNDPFNSVVAFKGDAQGLILEAVKKNEDKMEYSRILHAIKANFNHKYEEYRKKWGGGIMGSKSQVIQVMLTKLNVLSIWAQPQPQLQSQSSSVLLDDRSDRLMLHIVRLPGEFGFTGIACCARRKRAELRFCSWKWANTRIVTAKGYICQAAIAYI